MDLKKAQVHTKNRFLKLSLKKNRVTQKETAKPNRSSDVVILDESFDRLRLELTKKVQISPKIYSPIIVNDSCDFEHEDIVPKFGISETPSKAGNVTLNSTKENILSPQESKISQPSNGGWSPAQDIICATPRHETIPSTPNDIANESLEQCSMKKIEQSHKKVLDNLYGDKWKTIPSLFKSEPQNHDNLNGISKKLQFDDDIDSDKENIRHYLVKNRELYLTGSERKFQGNNDFCDIEKKSKKKLYTEKVPSTPEPRKLKNRSVSTTKKRKSMTITEMVNERIGKLTDEVDALVSKVKSVTVTPVADAVVAKRLSFIGSLADNVPSWRCNIEAIQYIDKYKTLREQLSKRLFKEYNREVFKDSLDADMPIIWDTKLRSTAGTTTNRLIKNAKGERIRTSSIKLSTKVLDAPQRLRDTLIHELCHAATWLIDGELRAGHGPLWKKWATRAITVFPELGEISRCHNMEIHFKYSYKCTKCGYSIKRHSKSIDVTKKCCGYCRGTFEVIVNKKTKDGVVVSTPARKGGPNDFALYVKENYGTFKDGSRTHAQVMKLLGEQFSAKKTAMKNSDKFIEITDE